MIKIISKSMALDIWKKQEVYGIDYNNCESLIQDESDFKLFDYFGIEVDED